MSSISPEAKTQLWCIVNIWRTCWPKRRLVLLATLRDGCQSLRRLPQMLHYNLLCVLREWLMMIMQMLQPRAAPVIIAAEMDPFWKFWLHPQQSSVYGACEAGCFAHSATLGRGERGRGHFIGVLGAWVVFPVEQFQIRWISSLWPCSKVL